jgi:hypothetical protein
VARAGIDPDEVALQAYLAALLFNKAWIGVEVTGGWGTPHVQRIAREFHYPRVYRRSAADHRTRDESERLGWSTDPRTLPIMQARGNELLRAGSTGSAAASWRCRCSRTSRTSAAGRSRSRGSCRTR